MRDTKGTGALASSIDLRKYKAVAAANVELPAAFELEGMPEAYDQGITDTCVSCAIALIAEFYSRKQGDVDTKMSPGYNYGIRSNNYTGKGRHMDTAAKDFLKYGIVPIEHFPEIVDVPYAIELSKERLVNLYPIAYEYRPSSYYRVYNEKAMKAALYAGNPLMFFMEWYDDIEIDVDGVMRTAFVSGDYYHAMVIYGWDETGWKIQNSWGKGWGKEGRALMPYSIPMEEVFGFTDTYSENQKKLEQEAYRNKITELEAAIEENADAFDRMAAEIETKEATILALQEKAVKLEAAMIEKGALEGEIKVLTNRLVNEQNLSAEAMAELKAEIASLEADREEYIAVIRELNTEVKTPKECGDKLQALADENEKLWAELDAKDKELAAKEQQIIEIKKPFSSGVGQVLAKIINAILNWTTEP